MSWRKLRGIRLAVALGVALGLLGITGMGVAYGETTATSMTISVPKTVEFGGHVSLSAQLTDATGAPISGARVAFVMPGTYFLGTTSDVLIAEVLTNKEGVAEAEYEARNAGWRDVRADFRGNDRFAAVRVAAKFLVEEAPQQLYVQHAGAQVPGITGPTARVLHGGHAEGEGATHGAEAAPSGLAGLWPMLSVWPIVLALLIVWSLYGVAVRQMFTIAAAGESGPTSAWAMGGGGNSGHTASGADGRSKGNGSHPSQKGEGR